MSTHVKPGPRERLLAAAKKLIYAQGASVGVDAILEEAGVARRSLYQHFGGKDGLIAEVVRTAAREDEESYRAALEAGGSDPRERLLAVFDSLDGVISAPDFRGCRYLATDLALLDAAHPARTEARAYRQRVHSLLEAELDRLGHPHPADAANQLQLLIEGALVVGFTQPETHPAKAVRGLAEHIIGPIGHD